MNQYFSTEFSQENTAAEGLLTLSITGNQSAASITKMIDGTNINHLHFGMHGSFKPVSHIDWDNWETTIVSFLKLGFMCSLDIHESEVSNFNECGLNEYDNFIPIIHVNVPYVRLWNYNTVVKITDKFHGITNPGVWNHSLHDLMDRSKFTPRIKIK